MSSPFLRIALASLDDRIHRLCREVLSERIGNAWDLHFPAENPAATDFDLIIWDFCPEAPAPEFLPSGDGHRNLFLVDRKHLSVFREALPFPHPRILLKPVTHVTLNAFLEQCIADLTPGLMQDSGSAGTLRTDRDEILQSLLLANLRLQEYDQDRTAFLTRAVHDFRAPLTALTGYCGLMLDEQLGPLSEDQKEVLERMRHSAERLSRMASAMFQLGVRRRVDSGAAVLAANDIRECVEQALHELAHLILEKNLSVAVDINPPAEPLLFDAHKLEQVLVNLLDNACRFTPKFGMIEIRGYPFFWERRVAAPGACVTGNRRTREVRSPNSFRVNIRDSGPGIPSDHVNTIFEEYTSYSGGWDRSGGGLGLAICRLLMSQHRGHIWAESDETGAIFSLVLPLK